jgi:hypothetical protein
MLKMTEEGRDRVASLGFAEMIRAFDKYQVQRRVNQETRERMLRMIFAKVLAEPDRLPELLADEYSDELRQFADKHAAEIDVAVGKCLYTTLMIHYTAGVVEGFLDTSPESQLPSVAPVPGPRRTPHHEAVRWAVSVWRTAGRVCRLVVCG